MDLDLTGRRAVVCGSTRGIGRACAHALAHLGATITLVARDAAALEAVRAQLPTGAGQEHRHAVADFSDPDAVGAVACAVAADAPQHVLVHNTGGPPGGLLAEAAPEALRSAFEMHVLSGQHLVQALAPGMRDAGFGRVINIISTSVKAPIPGLGVSNTIRGAVASWAKTLAGELGPDGITVNNVLPGFTWTDRLESIIQRGAAKAGMDEAAFVAQREREIPMRRFARPEEVASAVAFLHRRRPGYVTGINLPVDGGRLPTL